MKVIIAGGRDYILTPTDLEWLEALHKVWCFSEIISGAAKGADEAGEVWAVGLIVLILLLLLVLVGSENE